MKALRIILLILIIIGIGLLLTKNIWVPELVDKIISFQEPFKVVATSDGVTTNVTGNMTCKNTPNYFVVEKSLEDSVGTEILIKYKTGINQSFKCEYRVEMGDLEIKNESAEYFFGITNNFLIIDSGTAPYPRGLIIYNLNTRKKVYTDMYSTPISVDGNLIKYWNPVNIEVTEKNCPQLAEYTSGGLGAGIESYVTLDLSNLIKKDFGEYRCSARQ